MWLFLSKRRRRIEPLHFYRQFIANEDFFAGYEPTHVGCLDTMFIQQITSRPRDRGRAIAKGADLFCL